MGAVPNLAAWLMKWRTATEGSAFSLCAMRAYIALAHGFVNINNRATGVAQKSFSPCIQRRRPAY